MSQSKLYEMIQEAAGAVRARYGTMPEVAIILGTGLGGLAEKIEVECAIEYQEIPHFVTSTVESHKGRLLLGKLAGRNVVAMQGRFHYYEGYSMQQITFPVRVMQALGARTLLVSNACGGLNPQFASGDLMIIEDHINMLGDNPLIGPNDERLGARFPDMSQPYSHRLIELAQRLAVENRIPVRKGVYVAVPGPTLETRAEYRMLRGAWADVVGMSTVPEVIVAVHGGMEVLGMSIITDMGLPDAIKPTSLAEILEIAGEAEPKMTNLMSLVVSSL